jgi:hypothetical protein
MLPNAGKVLEKNLNEFGLLLKTVERNRQIYDGVKENI